MDAGADAERRGAAVRNWRRRSHGINLVRRVLPLMMIAVLGGLGWWLFSQASKSDAAAPTGPVEIHMKNPVFQGRDDGRPFILQASEAVRDGKDYARIALVDPKMEIQEKPGEPPTRISAATGVYREDTLILDLKGDVRYSDAAGWRFLTTNAVVDTRRDVVTGNRGIEGEGPSGQFKADGYVIYNHGERVVLRGNVRTVSDEK
ncbi:MAG: LPS export ABC transporter periplasmic protein LptC [Proteobacteria bacterium]|nr:LPS export ABC transporter periplasmic protein LptC [Pseudomonadota bacterium]